MSVTVKFFPRKSPSAAFYLTTVIPYPANR